MVLNISTIDFPELFVGIVAPIGTELEPVIDAIKQFAKSVNYDVEYIHITDVFVDLQELIPPKEPLVTESLASRYHSFIAYGNQVRDHADDDAALAAMAIKQIVASRINKKKKILDRFSKTIYVIRQLKRKEEVDLLRAVYGDLFFQISVYSRRDCRVNYLSGAFARDSHSTDDKLFRELAEKYVVIDENEQSSPHGQRVGKVFHDGEYIVDADVSVKDINGQVSRFFELIFSSNSITPTKNEYGLYAANSAALRTSDLSRQVGAAIFTNDGEILALGCNEVPKAGGGTYWCDSEIDAREFQIGYDSNEQRKNEILAEIRALIAQEASSPTGAEKALEKSSIMDLLEFGRIIHAEMSAITDAARHSGRLKDSHMFVTTFPCHMCAKHIIASGIKSVVFLEPYPKSLAARLHNDSIKVDGITRGRYDKNNAVEFKHFSGVTPRRYRELFENGKRKDDHGKFQKYINGIKKPKISVQFPFYVQMESEIIDSLSRAIDGF